MARTQRMTVLRPWQKEISKADWEKKVLIHDRNVGFNPSLNKYYITDLKNPAYIQHITARKKAKSDERKALRQRASDLGYRKGLKDGVKQFKNSDIFKKLLVREFDKGKKSVSSSTTLIQKIAKKQAKMLELQNDIESLKKKTS